MSFLQVIDNTALKLDLPFNIAQKVVSSIERSESISSSKVAVYWDFEEAYKLAKITDDFRPNDAIPEIPSPILRDYNWPGVFTPFEHQKTTASFLSIRPRAFCFNEAGTGKTSAAIWAADYLMNLGYIKRVLVICPLSIMHTAWYEDIFNTAMHRKAAVAHGDRKKRAEVINSDYEFVIINYDGVAVVSEEIDRGGFDLIIVDEANSYKSTSTKRWKVLSKLVKNTTWLWMMTGTPASQSPVDAYGLAKLISPNRVPKFSSSWRDKVMTQVSRFKWVPRASSTKIVHMALQPAIRFIKSQCLDLPEVVHQTRIVPLTQQALVYYKKLKAQMLIEAAGEQVSAVNAAASLSKLLQISGGAVYSDERNVVEFDVSPRLKALKEVLDETEHKVIVFVPFLHTIQIVSEFLTSEGVTNEIINGAVSAKGRADIITRFQNGVDPRVLIIQPQSASHGVTLTAANTAVFWSPVMSVETYLQCIARIDRVGQKNSMTVVNIQGSEVERKMYAMVQGKVNSHQKLVDLYKQVLEEV